MGNKVSIPRSFADQIGVADVLPSIRRHYIPLFDGQLTTGVIWPGVGAVARAHTTTYTGSNGINLLQRNFTVERAFMAAVTSNTTDAATTGHRVDILGGGTTIARVGGRLWSGTTTPWAQVMSTTPSSANLSASTPLRIQCVRKIDAASYASIALVGREALDS
jgi:hypothetical protein